MSNIFAKKHVEDAQTMAKHLSELGGGLSVTSKHFLCAQILNSLVLSLLCEGGDDPEIIDSVNEIRKVVADVLH